MASDSDGSRVKTGSSIISLLGVVFGVLLIVYGTFINWRSDAVLGLFSRTGWRSTDLVSWGDGKITLFLGAVAFLSLVLGAALRVKWFYAASLLCAVVVMALTAFELVTNYTRPGLTTAGTGLYMMLGGSVVGILCSVGGYYMVGRQQP